MSETTGDGNKQPDPDKDESQDQPSDADQGQDQASGTVFNDPTAPVWADPTAPIPSPTAPKAPSAPVQDTAPVPPVPPAAPPLSNPYAQQSPAQQYSQPTGQYGQPQPGQQYPAYGQQSYATGAPAPTNTSAIVLTILSGLSVLTCNILAIGSLVFGIMALNKNAADPGESRRLTKIGWIVFASVWAFVILGGIALVAILVVTSTSTSTGFGY